MQNHKKTSVISQWSKFDKKYGYIYFSIIVLLIPVTIPVIISIVYILINLDLIVDNLKYLPLLFLFALLWVVIINLLINIQGIEIDLEKNIFRNYKKFIFFKYGSWIDFKDVKILSITSDPLTIGKSYYSGGHETHFYYYVSFVNETSQLNIKIAEFRNYYKAYDFAKKTSIEFNLEIKDYVKGKTAANTVHMA